VVSVAETMFYPVSPEAKTMGYIKKEARGFEDQLGTVLRTLGSERGQGVPRIFQNTGGPLMGSLVQGLLGGAVGAGTAGLLSPLYRDRLDPRRTALAAGILGFLAPGVLHSPALATNLRMGVALNTPASHYTPGGTANA